MKQKPKDQNETKEILTLEIASDLRYLELVHVMVDWLTSQGDFTEEEAFHISVAISEAVSNAIIHGNKENLQKRVKIKFDLFSDGLKATIHDEGQGFNPEDVPDPLQECNLLKDCGRGIYYMKCFMDEVHFNRLSQGMGMEVSLLKHAKRRVNKKLNVTQKQDKVI